MQLFTNTPVFLANPARSSLDPVTPTPDAEQGLPAPIELDADTLRHIGGGVTEISTPVVSW